MSVQAQQQAPARPPSGRYIRAYLTVWGLLAAGGLTYLASLAWQMELRSPPPQQIVDAERGLRVANQALAEVGGVRSSVNEMRKDLGRVKETLDQREAQERESQSRLLALEERVTSLATPQVVVTVPQPGVTAKQKTADMAKKAGEQRASARIISVTEGASPAAAAEPPHEGEAAGKLETGSITSPPPVASFGEAQVTPAPTQRQQRYSVQVGAGPSLDALRFTWSMLIEKHGALAALQPRVVPPRAGSGVYRLVAGPLASKEDAEKVCADMGVGRQGCLPTTALGEPL